MLHYKYMYSWSCCCLVAADSSFLLANAHIFNYPIVYCNDAFCKLTGYTRAEVMQRPSTCSFMAGEDTSEEALARFTSAFERQEQDSLEILLYKKPRDSRKNSTLSSFTAFANPTHAVSSQHPTSQSSLLNK